MPEIRDYYTDVNEMDLPTLHVKRQELLETALRNADGTPDYASLGDDTLAYLLAITRQLRKHAAVGTRTRSPAKREKAAPPTVESLA